MPLTLNFPERYSSAGLHIKQWLRGLKFERGNERASDCADIWEECLNPTVGDNFRVTMKCIFKRDICSTFCLQDYLKSSGIKILDHPRYDLLLLKMLSI